MIVVLARKAGLCAMLRPLVVRGTALCTSDAGRLFARNSSKHVVVGKWAAIIFNTPFLRLPESTVLSQHSQPNL